MPVKHVCACIYVCGKERECMHAHVSKFVWLGLRNPDVCFLRLFIKVRVCALETRNIYLNAECTHSTEALLLKLRHGYN